MRKFWGVCNNDKYNVGCSGATVYIYDKDGKELKRFKDAPYVYRAKFKPNSNILVAKSTGDFLVIYDLDELKLLKKIKTSQVGGAQDGGFEFSKDGLYLYNIESPIYSTQTRLTIYDMKDYSIVKKLFENHKKIFLKDIEFDDNNVCYLWGFMRNDEGVFDYGFIAKLDNDNLSNIKVLDRDKYECLSDYKSWENYGFSDKELESCCRLKNLKTIKKATIIDTYNSL